MDIKKGHDFRNLNYVTKRKRMVLYKHLSSPRPEIKKYNPLHTDQTNPYDAISICNIAQPTSPPTDSYGSWEMIQFQDPLQGTASYNRVGNFYSLKYLKIKGYVEVNWKCEFKVNYKLLLIRADAEMHDFHQFLNKFYHNYQFPSGWTNTSHTFVDDATRMSYGRHNYYKMVRNVDTWGEGDVVIRVINDGTITNFPQRTESTVVVGTNPSITTTSNDGATWPAYYPININVTVNDNIKVGKERYYLMLITDQPVGYTRVMGSQGLSRSHAYADRAFELSFFTLAYYTDT